MNIDMKPIEKRRGVFRLIDPPQRVAIQLNILTPVGIAIAIVVIVNIEFATTPSPTVNI
jgi:hypothetical protein